MNPNKTKGNRMIFQLIIPGCTGSGAAVTVTGVSDDCRTLVDNAGTMMMSSVANTITTAIDTSAGIIFIPTTGMPKVSLHDIPE